MVLHLSIAAPKLELLASKPNQAFFLGHPVLIFYLRTQCIEKMSDSDWTEHTNLTAEPGLRPQDRHQVCGRGHDLGLHLDIQEPGLGLCSIQPRAAIISVH